MAGVARWGRAARWVGIGLLLLACVPGDGNVAVDPSDDTPVVFEVPKGATGGGLGTKLTEAGLISSEFNWKVFLKRGADAGCIKAGKYERAP